MALSTIKQRWLEQNITHAHRYTTWYMRQQTHCASWHLRTPIRVNNMRPSNPEHKSYTYVTTFMDAIWMMWQRPNQTCLPTYTYILCLPADRGPSTGKTTCPSWFKHEQNFHLTIYWVDVTNTLALLPKLPLCLNTRSCVLKCSSAHY
jgi:hypothetical protein